MSKFTRGSEDLINHLADVLSEGDCQDEDSLREVFAEEGLDYDNIVRDGLIFIRKLKQKTEERDADQS